MTCINCKTSNAPHELADGKCLKCLQKEIVTLRLMVAHTVMAIENGQPSKHPNTGEGVYTQSFGQGFVDHLKSAIGALVSVNTQPSESPKTEPISGTEKPA